MRRSNDPRKLWMVFFAGIVITLGVSGWCEIVGLSGQLVFTKETSLSSALATSQATVGLFGLTGISAVVVWNFITNCGEYQMFICAPGVVYSVCFTMVIILMVLGLYYRSRVVLLLGEQIQIILNYFFEGAVVGAVFSFIPHVPGHLSDFKTDLLLMTAIPVSGVIVAAMPWTFSSSVYHSYYAAFIISPLCLTFLILIVICLLFHRFRFIRRCFIEEGTSLLVARRRKGNNLEPIGYEGEIAPLNAAWTTIRRTRPFPAMFSLMLASYVGTFFLSTCVRNDLKFLYVNGIMANSSGRMNSPDCYLPFGSGNVALFILMVPSCLVPVAIHKCFLKQETAEILQPILAAVITLAPPLISNSLGDHLLKVSYPCNQTCHWPVLAPWIILACLRAALVAAAYVDLWYQVYLAVDDVAFPVGTAALATVSGSVGVAFGALNTLVAPADGTFETLRQFATVFMFPVTLFCAVFCTLVWRKCRPIPIEL